MLTIMTRKTILSLLLALMATGIQAKDYNMTLFGIMSDGTTMNTRSIQRGIDYISEHGGGRLVFSVGRYLTGTIHLKSNVTIHLGEGAVLVGSTNPYDYDRWQGWYSLIMAVGQENIGITGLGVIDGRGRTLANNFTNAVYNGVIDDPLVLGRVAARPKLIYLRECKQVTVRGVVLKNPAFWTQTYDQCEHLTISGITVDSRAYWNNDGMDIVDSRHVLVENCYVDATDDGICLKSHESGVRCEDITVRNNKVCSSASGIKFGTVGKGGFKDIRIINNTVFDTFRSAITIQAVDGGVAENILVDSLRAVNTGNPIYLVVGERGGRSGMHDVTIRNLYCEVPAGKPDAGYDFEGPTEDNPRNISPSAIVGLKDNLVENVMIENVEIVYPGGGNPAYAHVGLDELDKVPEMPKAYPEFSQHKELPAWGFYVRHAKNVTMKNVTLRALQKDYRPAIVTDDLQGGSFQKIKIQEPAAGKKPKIYTWRSTGVKK